MSFINEVMANEVETKEIVLFDQPRNFKDAEFPSEEPLQAFKEETVANQSSHGLQVWLKFILILLTFIFLLNYINRMPIRPFTKGLQAAEVQVPSDINRGEIKSYSGSVEREQVVVADNPVKSVQFDNKPSMEQGSVVIAPLKNQQQASKKVADINAQTKTRTRQAKQSEQLLDPTKQSIVKQASKVVNKVAKKPTKAVLDLRPSSVVFEKNIIKQNNNSASQKNEVAYLLAANDFVSATLKLNQMLENNPADEESRKTLASILVKQNRRDQALWVYQDGLRINPKAFDLAEPYAYQLVELGESAKALRILKNAAPQLQQNLKYYSFIAALEQQMGNHKNAISGYERILSINDKNGKWWLGLAISLMSEARNKEALFAFERSMNDARVSPALRQFANQHISKLEDRGS